MSASFHIVDDGSSVISGVPDGGTAGQFLRKTSADDFDAAFATPAISEVDGLQTALDAKAAQVDFDATADSVTQLQTDLDAAEAAVTQLQTDLDGKADASHAHAIADVTGLTAALAAKAAQTALDTTQADLDLAEAAILLKAPIANPTFTGTVAVGTGDAVSATSGQKVSIHLGTAASGDTSFNPAVKVERFYSHTDALAVAAGKTTGDLGDELSVVNGIGVGNPTCEAQVVGVRGAAYNQGTSNPGTQAATFPDACGIYGVGQVFGSGVGLGIGAYFSGQRTTTTGGYSGVQIQVVNNVGSATVYNSADFSSSAIWAVAGGTSDTGAGLIFGNPFGKQFTNGICFNAQVAGGKTGPVSGSAIRDDSNSTITLDVNGSHTTAVDTVGATLSGGYAVLMGASHKVGWTDAALTRTGAATLKVTDGASGSGTIEAALTGNASTATALATGRTIAMTGDVTWNSGTFNGTGNVTAVGTIANDAVSNAKLADMANGTLKGRATTGTGDPEDVSLGIGLGFNGTVLNSANGSLHIPLSGLYISPAFTGGAAATTAGVADRVELIPFVPGADVTITALAVNVTTAVASANMKVGIYTATSAGLPDALVRETGSLDCSTTGVKSEAYAYTFKKGTLYWLAVRSSSTATIAGLVATQLRPLVSSTTGQLSFFRKTLAFATALPGTWTYNVAEWNGGTASVFCPLLAI